MVADSMSGLWSISNWVKAMLGTITDFDVMVKVISTDENTVSMAFKSEAVGAIILNRMHAGRSIFTVFMSADKRSVYVVDSDSCSVDTGWSVLCEALIISAATTFTPFITWELVLVLTNRVFGLLKREDKTELVISHPSNLLKVSVTLAATAFTLAKPLSITDESLAWAQITGVTFWISSCLK